MIVFLIICSSYFFDNCTSQHFNFYLFICSTIFSTIARIFYLLQFENDFEIHAFASRINAFFLFSFEKISRFVRSHFIYSLFYLFDNRFQQLHEHIFITVWNIWSKYTRLHVKSICSFRFCSRDFSIFSISIRSSWILLFFCFFVTVKLRTFFLKTLFTYDKRLAILKSCLKFFETFCYFKTIMIVVDFSENNHSNFNVMQCVICSLLIYDEYFTFESLKKYLENASHCSFVLQFQQEIESKKIVEKSKIEFFSVFVTFVKFLNTYEEKLTSFQYWIWTKSDFIKKILIVAEFRCIDDEYRTKCMHCSLKITSNRNFESLKKHFQKSSECSFVLQFEIAKFIFVTTNIDYFDAIFLCDIQKFDLYHETTSFCQHLQNIQINYREIDLVQLFHTCLRDFVFVWYKKQNENEIVKQNLNE